METVKNIFAGIFGLVVYLFIIAALLIRGFIKLAIYLYKSITQNGLNRSYHLHIPSLYRKSMATPLVVALHGGGHTWPGGYQYLPEFLIGKTNRDLDASETIWNFFKGYRR